MSESLKERLRKKRKKLAERSAGSGVIFIKEGTLRIRILPVGEDNDWALEMTHFYLGPTIKGIFSASSLGLPCPVMEAYEELKAGSDSDKDLAKSFTPRKKYLVPAVIYEDERGKKIDADRSGQLVMLTPTIYGEIIDMFLDPDLGDFTDPKEGYDLKIKRTGSGKLDTEYTVSAMRPTPLAKEWAKEVDLNELAKKVLIPYEDAKEKVEEFLLENGDDEDEAAPKAKSKSKSKSKKKRKKSNGDM